MVPQTDIVVGNVGDVGYVDDIDDIDDVGNTVVSLMLSSGKEDILLLIRVFLCFCFCIHSLQNGKSEATTLRAWVALLTWQEQTWFSRCAEAARLQ